MNGDKTMISKNLTVSIPEDNIGGDSDAVIIKTTKTGNVIIELAFPKIAIKLEDLKDAIDSLSKFIDTRKKEEPITVQETNSYPVFEYHFEEEKPEHLA